MTQLRSPHNCITEMIECFNRINQHSLPITIFYIAIKPIIKNNKFTAVVNDKN